MGTATAIKRVNTRLAANTASKKLKPLEIGDSITVKRLEFGEVYRGSRLWLVDDYENKYWAGAFDYKQNISLSSVFQEYLIPEIWEFSKGEGVKVGIIDCGLRHAHRSISNTNIFIKEGFEGNSECLHGTYMASIIAGSDFDSGFVGLAPGVEIQFCGYGDIETLTPDKLLQCLHELKDVDIISMSFAKLNIHFTPSSHHSKSLIDFIHKLSTSNKILLASTGNKPLSNKYYPSGYSEVISVSAIDSRHSLSVHPKATIWDGVDIVGPFGPFFNLSNLALREFPNTGLEGTSVTTAVTVGILALAVNKLKSIGQLTKAGILKTCCKQIEVSRNQRKYFTHALDSAKIFEIIKQQ